MHGSWEKKYAINEKRKHLKKVYSPRCKEECGLDNWKRFYVVEMIDDILLRTLVVITRKEKFLLLRRAL